MRLTLHTDLSLRVLMQVGLNDGDLTTIEEMARSFENCDDVIVSHSHVGGFELSTHIFESLLRNIGRMLERY